MEATVERIPLFLLWFVGAALAMIAGMAAGRALGWRVHQVTIALLALALPLLTVLVFGLGEVESKG
ncbi:MAG: hypothetical protein AUJ92_16425 [Armatimonadetes bacterium CG2_30_59_28]|nr:hypothetical protein [Armatimonadota bacterium]OIO91499.1 MAG: hypothetical protein AUJ92_16425 [Armatimonadetes bacterium CG2_30_59_28]PIU65942.1 MAG: hypothetical protein COS85_06600 [Armatimonadetes bacterium CG07_land_8_20_14_0_80_59_28]PIX40833.1 MAG: hypothetical protein COZ56_13655 [Armatimonadetes bacterium CG_4_8_14_3_um_filter_58_9]PIY43313.1 MAG: hypothetical protein COZ05_11440 [Armatimonadetes bacterium CG_4_10_14_3_um_filter_59_10]PJB61673.1 MAG: hypothetical protein CO095_201